MKERDAKTNQSATALCVHTAVPDAASAARRHVVPLGAEAARVMRQQLQRGGMRLSLRAKSREKGGMGGMGAMGGRAGMGGRGGRGGICSICMAAALLKKRAGAGQKSIERKASNGEVHGHVADAHMCASRSN